MDNNVKLLRIFQNNLHNNKAVPYQMYQDELGFTAKDFMRYLNIIEDIRATAITAFNFSRVGHLKSYTQNINDFVQLEDFIVDAAVAHLYEWFKNTFMVTLEPKLRMGQMLKLLGNLRYPSRYQTCPF